MPRLIRVLAAFSVLVLSLYLLSWFDMPHLAGAGLFAVALDFVASRLATRPRRTREQGVRRRETTRNNPLLHGVHGGMLSLGTLLLLALGHGVALTVPAIKEAYLDRNRRGVERDADRLESQAEWLAAAEFLAERSAKPASSAWSATLTRRACLDLAQAAATSPDRATASGILSRARQLAASSNVAVPIVDAFHHAMETQGSQGERVRHIAESLHATLLSCGDASELSFTVRRRYYQQAQDAAKAYSLDGQVAEERLRKLEMELAEQAPVALSPGATTRLVGVQISPDPRVVTVDFTIVDGSGVPIAGLQCKDLAAHSAAGEANVLALCSASIPSGSLSVAVLLDCSNSTQGERLAAARQGAKRLLVKLPPAASAKLFAFATSVTALTDWTPDRTGLLSQIDTIPSGGNTALWAALAIAERELQQREGARAIVVFTDGKDTVGGPDLNETVSRCRTNHTSLSTVGLATAELDSKSLQYAASVTGGSFFSADRVDDLVRRFDELAARLTAPAYRATIIAEADEPMPITVTIGGANRVSLIIDPQAVRKSPRETSATSPPHRGTMAGA